MFHKPDRRTFAALMAGRSTSLLMPSLRLLLGVVFSCVSVIQANAQGTENFANLPTTSAASYLTRSWTGTDGVTWTAEGARTDQNLNAKAICFAPSGNRWVTSPNYANGMGTLTFNYVRGFTNTSSRSLQVWVNGAQVGATIVVSPTSDVVATYSATINVSGNVQLQIRSTGASQVIVDDISWTSFAAGPTVSFNSTTPSSGENAGSVQVDLSIAPAATAAGTITITVANGTGVAYGAGADYTTTPAVAANTITLNIAAGATTASFNVNLVDDVVTEANETITFTITGVTGGLAIGTPTAHTFTITDNDVTPTVNFSTLSISVLENAGVQNFQMSITPAAATAGSIVVQVLNGAGAGYGLGNDYLTNPATFGGNITVNFAAGATTASFTVTVLDDAAVEATETVSFTVNSVPAGFAIGGSNTALLTIGDNDTPPTALTAGDLVIVGVNANNQTCSGISAEDEVSFFSFKPIVPGTQIILSDNGYERCNAGMWGNSEGTVRMQRTGIAIPAGQVITFRFSNTSGAANVTAVAPDNGWNCTSLNGTTTLNLNNGGDQLFFMQGGAWNTGTAGAHNATYSGNVLFAFSTNPTFPWSATCASPAGNQRSNLPPGMECFSMAPTLATDYNKYVGPITAATQRNWIIRLDDVTNWSTYASCSEYNTQGYNWLTAPIMPITNATFLAGKWTGAVSTDWFECKNWDDAQVPTITTDVLIDQTAIRHCSVGLATGLSPAGTGLCASVSMTNSGLSRNLTIEANSTLSVNGPVNVERTAGTGVLNLNILAGGTLNATDLYLASSNAGSGEARLNCATATSIADLETNLTIAPGGRVDIGTGGTIRLGGNWSNMESEAMFVENTGNVIFNGSTDQFITSTGFEEVFYNISLQKPGGALNLSIPTAVRGTLDLTTGLVNTTAINLLSMRAGSGAINASDVSFVNGPMEKIGLTPFVFPVGKGNSLRPCGLKDLTGTATDAFTAEYFPLSPITTFGPPMEPTLNHISDCEYWMIDRSAGNANATVDLTWDSPESCGVTSLPELRVARWDGTIWRDRGNGGTIGNTIAGTVSTAAVQTLFSPWTLASVDGSNPLPITLISFTAKAEGPIVRLDWVTASERDNAFFTLERSADGIDFTPILNVAGAGTSYSTRYYTDHDREPLAGINYYRLRQTDLDGTSTLSAVVSVLMKGEGQSLVVYGSADVLQAVHSMGAESRYEVLDMTGRLIKSGISGQEGRTEVPAADLTRGAYIFRISEGDRVESVRFVY
jgi:hypothetical protein